jgi:hypothetical protein
VINRAGVEITDCVKILSGLKAGKEEARFNLSTDIVAIPDAVSVSEKEYAIAPSGLPVQASGPADGAMQSTGPSAKADVQTNKKCFYFLHNYYVKIVFRAASVRQF